MLAYIIVAALAVMLLSLSGVVFISQKLFERIQKNIRYLISLSVGVFLAIAVLDLIPETIELSGPRGGLFVLAGFLLFALLGEFLHGHHHHEDDCREQHNRSSGIMILIGDLGHNFVDGIIITSAFLTNTNLGLITTLGIFLHEFTQEISEFFVLIQAGFSKTRALLLNFLASGTILIGAITAYFFLFSFKFTVGPILGIAAGNLLYIATSDLLPEVLRQNGDKNGNRKRGFLKQFSFMFLGALIVFLSHL